MHPNEVHTKGSHQKQDNQKLGVNLAKYKQNVILMGDTLNFYFYAMLTSRILLHTHSTYVLIIGCNNSEEKFYDSYNAFFWELPRSFVFLYGFNCFPGELFRRSDEAVAAHDVKVVAIYTVDGAASLPHE